MRQTLKTLLDAAIDYAGLFPPARLDMATSIRNYGDYLAGPRAWALGRFVVPASRLEEFNFHIGDLESDAKTRLLRLSTVVGDDLDADFERVLRFNRWHAERTGGLKAVIDAVEVKAAFSETIMRVSDAGRDSVRVFFEIPVEQDPGELVSVIARAGGAAKVRTGGVSAGMFPPAANLVRFLKKCLAVGVPFKATGGLYHPLRGLRPVAPGPDAPKAMTHGYLNLLLCAAFMYDGMTPDEAVAVLNEESADAFAFEDEGVTWRGRRLAVEALIGARRDFAVSFGSASFKDPMDHLGGLNPA